MSSFLHGLLFLSLFASWHNVVRAQEGFVELVGQNFNERLNSQLEQHILSYHNQELAYRAYASYYDRADVALPGFHKLFRKMASRAHERAQLMTSQINERGGLVRFPVVQLKDACNVMASVLTDLASSRSAGTLAVRTKPHICHFQSTEPDPYLTHKKKKKRKQKKKTDTVSKFSSWFSQKEDTSATESVDRTEWYNGLHGLEDAVALERSIHDGLIHLMATATNFGDPLTRHRLEDFTGEQVEAIKETEDLVTRLRQYLIDGDYPLGEYLLDQELQQYKSVTSQSV